MIWIAILFLSSVSAFGQDLTTTTVHPDSLIKRYQMECVEETRVDLDTVVKIRSKNWVMHYIWILEWLRHHKNSPLLKYYKHLFEEMKNQFLLAKDWALCVLMKSGVMTKEGVYKIDVAMQRVPMEERYILEAQIDACLTPKPMPARDIAYLFINCFQRMNSKYSSKRYNLQKQIDACLTSKAMPASAIAYYFIRCFQRMNSNSKFSSAVSAFAADDSATKDNNSDIY